MTDEPGTTETDLLTILELLAEEAPQGRLEELLQRARRAGQPPQSLARLERAVSLAGRIHVSQGRSRQREDSLADLVDTARDLTFPHGLDALLRVVTRRVRRLLNFDLTCVALLDGQGAMYVHTSEGSITALVNGLQIDQGRGLGHRALATGAPVWTADYRDDDGIEGRDHFDEVIQAEGLHALMAVPLVNGDRTVGVLYGACRTVRHFCPDELGVVCSLAVLAAVAIERAERLEQARGDIDELELDGFRTRTSLVRMQQLSEAHSRTMNMLLAGADLTSVAKAAGDALDGTLQLRDPSGRILAGGDIADLDETAVAEGALDAHARRGVVAAVGNTWVAPVIAGAENLGQLVLRPATALVGEDERLLYLTAQAFAIQLLLQRSTAMAEGPVRDELLDDLLASHPRAAHQLQHIAQRVGQFGLDLDAPYVLLVVRPEGGEPGRALVWASSYAHRMSGLKTARDGRIVLLLPGEDPSGAARAVAEELSPVLGHSVSVGVAGPGKGPADTSRIYHEALRCLDALTALNARGSTASARELGFLGLLLADQHDAEGFIESTLGPVLSHDRDWQTDLVATLGAYFAGGGSPTNAAESLHVHPNTVWRRLKRITELLGPQWQQPEKMLEVQLALRLQQTRGLLQRQGNAEASPQAARPIT
ncbi:helix-turn-helix domain-containing protein [Streptomyces sp. NPDC056670]|uniref:helix-turn-helix domain-containing protein n=1 Tax=Streptomyces sp. NPDC056670 TaxID=3345904 RepID=UPI003686F5FB